MGVYVDSLLSYAPGCYRGRGAMQAWRVGRRTGHRWCHLLADTLVELHTFAVRLGLRPEWFQGDHYDLTPRRRAAALKFGAVEVDRRRLVELRRLAQLERLENEERSR